MYQYLGFGLSVLLKPSHLEARQAASHQSYNVQPYLVHSTGPAISYHFRQKQIVYPTLIVCQLGRVPKTFLLIPSVNGGRGGVPP